MKPVPHSTNIPIPKAPSLEVFERQESSSQPDSSSETTLSDFELVAASSNTPVFINQSMLNKAEILMSRLKQWNLLEQETKISEFRHRNEKLSSFFDFYNGLCFCNDVDGLMMKLGYEYRCDEWRLFIDSSKASPNAVLLHNSNIHPSIPVAHAVQLKETYETMKLLLDALQYSKYSWEI